ncbi:MAG: vitamin K epoxide reductase family protein [Pseudomonadota bacterium]|nr:vitamin K epoxide reductase family protein [Pseudomonadota bacterium]
MKQLLMQATSGDMSPEELQEQIQNSDSPEMAYRRAIVGVSLIGIGAMAIVSLLQTGVVKHLPDPPVEKPHFDTDKVNSSKEAYSYGMPDAPLTIAAHSASLAIAAAGPPERYKNRPWLPLLATALALPQAAIAAKYLFYQMPKVDKAWCPYCVTDAVMHFATVALTIPESLKALGLSDSGRPSAQTA